MRWPSGGPAARWALRSPLAEPTRHLVGSGPASSPAGCVRCACRGKAPLAPSTSHVLSGQRQESSCRRPLDLLASPSPWGRTEGRGGPGGPAPLAAWLLIACLCPVAPWKSVSSAHFKGESSSSETKTQRRQLWILSRTPGHSCLTRSRVPEAHRAALCGPLAQPAPSRLSGAGRTAGATLRSGLAREATAQRPVMSRGKRAFPLGLSPRQPRQAEGW